MKILMVNKFLYPAGGCENHMLSLSKLLTDNGHIVQFFGVNEKHIVGNDFDIYVENYENKKFFNPFSLIYNRQNKKRLIELLDKFNPDIVHMHNISFHLTSSVIDACKEKNIPAVMTIHDPQLVCPNHMLFRMDNNEICNDCLKQNSFKPCLTNKCLKGSSLKSYLAYRESIYTHKHHSYEYLKYYICPSNFIANKLNEGGYQNNKIVLLRNFSNIISSQEISKKEDYILYFGRLSEEKGLKLLIEALPDDIQLIIAGDGPLKQFIESLNKNNIQYVGFKSGDELNNLIKKARFSIYPSIWYENCPLSIFESINLLTPVIGTNEGGIPELIEDGINGLLFKNKDVKDLKNKIRILYDDNKLLKEMIKNCYSFDKIPSKEQYYQEITKIYQEAINDEKND